MKKSKAVSLQKLRFIRNAATLLACSLGVQASAQAAIFTVNTTADTGAGSLRQAIIDANASAAVADTINFNIATGTQTITLNSALPSITSQLVIDGTTQPGFLGSPIIVLKPSVNASGINGLSLTSGSNLVKGLVFNGFGNYAIEITGATANGNTIYGNYIGVDISGNTAAANGGGVSIDGGADNNVIGGTTAAARNIISGNNGQGIRIGGAGTTGNKVVGNYIGTNAAGNADLGNSISGILIDQATATTVGGITGGGRNVISGNGNSGVHINDPDTTGNLVQGNYIGTNAAGTAAIGNTNHGVQISASAKVNTIGGTVAAARNVISGNGIGVWIQGSGTEGNTVQGNYIGTNAGATGPIANLTDGIQITGGSNSNTIGGTVAGARNVISGNANDGIEISGGDTRFHVVQGNYIGTNISGTNALPNAGNGIHIAEMAFSNTIGGNTAAARNVISANTQNGILIEGAGTEFNSVQGNFIGTNAAGTGALGNIGSGVQFADSTTTNILGGNQAGEGNRIAYNKANGVTVIGGETAAGNNPIRGNAIFANAKLGIDLNNDGVTLNDDQDPDTGGNALINYPTITGASQAGGMTTLTGTLNGAPSTNHVIDFYRSVAVDPSGYGEAEVYLGQVSAITNASGTLNAPFTFTFAGNYAGQYFTATATSDAGNTSEFARSSYSLSGRITNSSNVAIANVTVTRNGSISVLSNGAGYYTFNNVPVGNYIVVPTAPGLYFTPATRSVAISTANVSGQNFIGAPSGPYSINGRIASSNGVGLANVSVAIPGRPTVLSNGAGYFAFPNVPAGTYTFTPTSPGVAFTPVNRTATITNANVNNQNFVAATGYQVQGRVATSNGVGLANVTVSLTGGYTAVTNGAGYYTFSNIPNGTRTLTPSWSGWTFTPATKQITVNNANSINHNFLATPQ